MNNYRLLVVILLFTVLKFNYVTKDDTKKQENKESDELVIFEPVNDSEYNAFIENIQNNLIKDKYNEIRSNEKFKIDTGKLFIVGITILSAVIFSSIIIKLNK